MSNSKLLLLQYGWEDEGRERERELERERRERERKKKRKEKEGCRDIRQPERGMRVQIEKK